MLKRVGIFIYWFLTFSNCGSSKSGLTGYRSEDRVTNLSVAEGVAECSSVFGFTFCSGFCLSSSPLGDESCDKFESRSLDSVLVSIFFAISPVVFNKMGGQKYINLDTRREV